jgi:hypothetical protein
MAMPVKEGKKMAQKWPLWSILKCVLNSNTFTLFQCSTVAMPLTFSNVTIWHDIKFPNTYYNPKIP